MTNEELKKYYQILTRVFQEIHKICWPATNMNPIHNFTVRRNVTQH